MIEIEPITSAYSYQYDLMNYAIAIIKSPNALAQPVHTILMNLIGSRLSSKTYTELRLWAVEFPLLCKQHGINVAINLIRYEPKGAVETFNELIGIYEDIYNGQVTKHNTNLTQRSFKIGNGYVRAIGILSNRKKAVTKLGLFRKGAKKDIEINIFEEITELPEEKLYHLVNQATGGAKLNIRISIANPWVLSMWYVGKFNRFLPFNRVKLKTMGEQFKQEYNPAKKRLQINHITNHRINNFLSEAQHQELYDLWEIDETLANVADLGMPGMAEGLIYAPLLPKLKPPSKFIPTLTIRGGLDWGTATGPTGSATALIISRIATHYRYYQPEAEYYHSNAHSFFKTDRQIITELLKRAIEYIKENLDAINEIGGVIRIYYDNAAATLGETLRSIRREFLTTNDARYALKMEFMPSVKYNVTDRIQVVKFMMNNGIYRLSKELTPKHYEELEGAMYDPVRKVKGLPTRLDEADHTLDASEYAIGPDLYNFADQRWLNANKMLKVL